MLMIPAALLLRTAGCTEIFEEKASSIGRAWPKLARLLDRPRRGDTLILVRASTAWPTRSDIC
jgi:hypothetical protein